MKMFAVYDHKAASFCLPFFSQNADIAIRDFAYAVNDRNQNVSKYAADFDLYQLGDLDQTLGVVTPHDVKILLGNGAQFKEPRHDEI
ncbi:MAG: nonstructural protein [Microviridae sp.]|nr:MAG: nonstructural protein [Microviridae sp.]